MFAQLRKPVDPKVLEQREREVSERVHASYAKAEQRQNEIVRTENAKTKALKRVAADAARSASTRPRP